MSRLVDLACAVAREDARDLRVPDESGRRFAVTVAVGDPQAPLSRFFSVLDHHGLLDERGRVREDVRLVSMGDHFDWGGRDERQRAGDEGYLLLSWLAAHPPDQVIVLAGNHDLARVGELASFSDEEFAAAQERADRLYWTEARDEAALRAFVDEHPALPSAEVAARDLATFQARQRDLVLALLASERMRLAFAPDDRLLATHAGVTTDDLVGIGVDPRDDARAIASALQRRAREAVARFCGAPLSIEGLHRPGDAAFGEGRGVLYHRPCEPGAQDDPGSLTGTLRRRFDPRALPRGLVQVIGHIRDAKCRKLMPGFVVDEPGEEGEVRHLVVDDGLPRYRRGAPRAPAPDAATLIFVDNAMNVVEPSRYEVLDLGTLAPLRRVAAGR